MADQDQLKLLEAHLRAQISALQVDRARVDAEQKRIDADLARYQSALMELTRIGMPSVTAEPPVATPAPAREVFEVSEPQQGMFAGLELRDAIHKYLSLQREMRSPKEIWAALEKAGFKILSGYPIHAVSSALRERAHRRGDVFKAGGRWGVVENFSTNFVRRVTKKSAGMGGKNAEEHGAKTSAGLQRRKDAGLQVGARPKLTPEQEREAEEMLRAKMAVSAVARHFGVVRQTILNRIGKERVKALRSGTAEATETDTTTSHLRVVK
jgi:transposase-like protein